MQCSVLVCVPPGGLAPAWVVATVTSVTLGCVLADRLCRVLVVLVRLGDYLDHCALVDLNGHHPISYGLFAYFGAVGQRVWRGLPKYGRVGATRRGIRGQPGRDGWPSVGPLGERPSMLVN